MFCSDLNAGPLPSAEHFQEIVFIFVQREKIHVLFSSWLFKGRTGSNRAYHRLLNSNVHRHTCDTDGQRQHQVVDSLYKEVSPFTSQFWWQFFQDFRQRRWEELIQLHDQCGILTYKQLHPWVPETAHILTCNLRPKAKKNKNKSKSKKVFRNMYDT